MNFNSAEFLIFLPVMVGLYWVLPHRLRWVLLLCGSYYFYGSWNPKLLILIFLTTLVSYLAALAMTRWPKVKKLLLWLTLFVCLGILIYYKYANFLIESILTAANALTGGSWSFEIHVLLPVGISFYTFQTLSYVIDVYRGDFQAEPHLGYYALFVSYFPQLVAGPIENPGNLLAQLRTEQRWSKEDFAAGMRILLCGFFRKCVVADFCGIYVNQLFGGLETANSLAIAGAGALFCLQMYCDFAGYSDIAAGAARMMGVRLMRNFERPYLARSYTEFFHRWHISLNRWFTSYVYIPLGGSRKGKGRKLVNTVIVFSLCGLWHGARWTYLFWGLYAAFFVCVESLMEMEKRFAAAKWSTPAGKLFRRSVMFLIFIPAALIFRAESVGQAGTLLAGLFTDWGFGKDYVLHAVTALGLDGMQLLGLVLRIVCMCRIYRLGQYDLNLSEKATAAGQRIAAYSYLILTIALCWISLLATEDAAGFAYFQF